MDGQRQMICVGIPNLFYIFFFSGELFKKRLKPLTCTGLKNRDIADRVFK